MHSANLPQRLAGGHGGGDRDVERTQARTHRDQKPRVGGGVNLLRHPRQFAAEQQDIVRLKAIIEVGHRGRGREQDEPMTFSPPPAVEFPP